MINQTQKIVLTLISVLILTVLSFFQFHEFFFNSLITPQLDGVNLVSTSILPQQQSFLSFIMVLALIPILLLMSDIIVQYKKLFSFTITLLSILICGILFMSFHLQVLKANYLSIPEISEEIQNSMSTSSIHAERYLGIGFLLGAIIPTTIFHLISRKRKS